MQHFDPRYEEVLNCAVTYASGLSLALEIVGSNLFGKSVEEWEFAIHQFEKSHDHPIQVILKANFDSLEEKERSVFLDIACCFKEYELTEVRDILCAHYGHCMKDYIDVLVGKSLLKLSHGTKPCYDTVTLHDLIEDMGKQINRLESLTELGERRRLRLPEVRESKSFEFFKCKCLTRIPGICGLPNLEKLSFEFCENSKMVFMRRLLKMNGTMWRLHYIMKRLLNNLIRKDKYLNQ